MEDHAQVKGPEHVSDRASLPHDRHRQERDDTWSTLEIPVDLADALALPGGDATPSPMFDDVGFSRYDPKGPVITALPGNLFQEAVLVQAIETTR